MGAPALAPNSESSNNNSFGANLACAATCRLVYGNSPGGRPRRHDRLLVARRGAHHDRQPGRHRAGRRARHRQRLPRGRAPLDRLVRRQDLPRDARRLHRRRRRGAGCGRAQGLGGSAYALNGIAVGDNLLLAANYAWNATGDASVRDLREHRRAAGAGHEGAGAARRAAAGRARARRSASRCSTRCRRPARAPRRARCAASCARAPAGGSTPSRRSRATRKLVLGTRGKFAVPKGKKGKIRFYIAVSKAQLLKAPFSTEGGSRVAETRLRVWYTPEGRRRRRSRCATGASRSRSRASSRAPCPA